MKISDSRQNSTRARDLSPPFSGRVGWTLKRAYICPLFIVKSAGKVVALIVFYADIVVSV